LPKKSSLLGSLLCQTYVKVNLNPKSENENLFIVVHLQMYFKNINVGICQICILDFYDVILQLYIYHFYFTNMSKGEGRYPKKLLGMEQVWGFVFFTFAIIYI